VKIDEHRTITIREDETCPYLMCGVLHSHSHPTCSRCGAVRFGNMFCPDCRRLKHGMVNPIVVRGALVDGAST